MTSAESLLRAILDDPEDDTLRLILADWLEEHGQPADEARAELIRVQVELARGTTEPDRHKTLLARAAELLAAHAEGWLGPLREVLDRWEFRRGTLWVSLKAGAFASKKGQAVAAEWFPRAWVQEVRLTGPARHLGALLDSPLFGQLRTLELFYNDLGLPGALALAHAPHLAGLSALTVAGNDLRDAWASALAASANLPRLASLDLAGNELTEVGVRALLAVGHGPRLHTLGLARCSLGAPEFRALAAAPGLA